MTLRMRTTAHRVRVGCKSKLSPSLLLWHRPLLASPLVARTIIHQKTQKIGQIRSFNGNGSTFVSQVRLYFQFIAYLPEIQKNINGMGLGGRVQLLEPFKHDVPKNMPMTRYTSLALLDIVSNDETVVIGI